MYSGKCNLNSVSVNDNRSSSAFNGNQFIQDNFIKFKLNLPKSCSNFISRSEVGKLPTKIKIWSQMMKYFVRLSQGKRYRRWCNDMCQLNQFPLTNSVGYILYNPWNVDNDRHPM